MKRMFISIVAFTCGSTLASAQPLSPKWEELTAEDFVTALARSANTCLLPFGIIEKLGPSGPLGTDLIDVRQITAKAVEREYTLVFPEYYFGQIFEAQHQPGTIAYSTHQKPCIAGSRSLRNYQLKAKLWRPFGQRADLLLAIPSFVVFSPFIHVLLSVFDEPVEQTG